MTEKFWKGLMLIFHVACWSCAILNVLYYIYVYSLDEDSTSLDYKDYYKDEFDKYPMLSLCLKNPFNPTELQQISRNVNATSYLEFLEGRYFSSEILKYDYQDVILNLSEYVMNYWSRWRNGTEKLYSPINYSNSEIKSTFSGFWSKKFYNCYGLKLPDDKELQAHSILLKNDIFSDKIRPHAYDLFTLLHYPNHLTTSLRSVRYAWKERSKNDSYGMIFTYNEVEIIKRRNKYNDPCTEHWTNYDFRVQQHLSEKVGCRAPYHNPNINKKKCSTCREMEKAKLVLRYDDHGISPPCRAIEKISYSYEEIDYADTRWERSGYFWITIRIGNPRFKEVLQMR